MTPSPPLGRWWGTLYITTLQGSLSTRPGEMCSLWHVQSSTAAAWATYGECNPCAFDHAMIHLSSHLVSNPISCQLPGGRVGQLHWIDALASRTL